MKRIAKYLLPALLLVAFSTTMQAQRGPGRGFANNQMADFRGPGGPGAQAMFMNIPDLRDEQKEQITAIRLENQKAMLSVRNQLFEKQARLRTLTTGGNYDEKAALKIVDEISALHNQLLKQRVVTHQKVRSVLTEDQQVVFDAAPFRGQRGRGNRAGCMRSW